MSRFEHVQVASFTLAGECIGKKNASFVSFPGLFKLGLRKTSKRLFISREKAAAKGRGSKRVSTRVAGLEDLFHVIAETAPRDPAGAAMIATRAASIVKPVIFPGSAYSKWHKDAMKQIAALKLTLPVVPDGNVVWVQAVFYVTPRSRTDLVNFIEATNDLLEDAGVYGNDYAVNSHDGSARIWTDPTNPRTEIAIWDLGPREKFEKPKVKMFGLSAHKGVKAPIRFAARVQCNYGPREMRFASGIAARGATRDAIVMQAVKVWRNMYGEPLPEGAEIVIEPPRRTKC